MVDVKRNFEGVIAILAMSKMTRKIHQAKMAKIENHF
jgi:hypothetical protein